MTRGVREGSPMMDGDGSMVGIISGKAKFRHLSLEWKRVGVNGEVKLISILQ